ncbi:DUF4148 domain-containing protein (plasmid) [Burkholderia thailandensis]|uniref:DUF4148 domain-containing protein n=1 Tax=Burkholderia thailandensis TaxID=57975 RepID=UPI00192D53B6|nr:DUF4148 domain-containing protein [Burkholderia thailandensis]MBS2132279.1 DUF4148 domain-containing protein [Burkholderia thailandensis]QRA15368.1 DUF4148 domain-containing protein [Burkholderia thailandensis]
MKSMIHAAIAASLLAIPAMTFAQQSNGPVTRAQVRAELIQLEQAGYRPGLSDPTYPANIQAAEARLHAQNGTAPGADSGYGPSPSGRSESGSHAGGNATDSIYFGH